MGDFSEIRRNGNFLEWKAEEKNAGVSVKTVLQDVFLLSAARIKSLKFDPEGIFVNGQRRTVRYRLETGDVLRILSVDSDNKKEKIVPVEMPLTILYEDHELIILNKPSGQVCHPSGGHYFDSLLNGLRFYLDKHDPKARMHLIGRLDKDTSGLVLCAKNAFCAERFQKMKAAGDIEKEYAAIVKGPIDTEEYDIDIPMRSVRKDDKLLMEAAGDAADALAAFTHVRVISGGSDCSFCRMTIRTGRMHQIRFHMARTGHPLLFDPLYGEGSRDIGILGEQSRQFLSEFSERTMLHAGRLRFRHPLTDEVLDLRADIPDDMKRIRFLRNI